MAASGGVVVGAEGSGSIVMSMARLVVVEDVRGVKERLRRTGRVCWAAGAIWDCLWSWVRTPVWK